MTIQTYLNTLNIRFKTGISREHTYRGDLQALLMKMLPDILVTNEPARVACGAPDYVLTKKDIPVGYIEAKDIGVDLKSKTLKEQFDRYRSGLNNLIFTDYMDFHFYKDGNLTTTIAIAKIENGNIIGIPDNYDTFENLIKNFSITISQTIKSPTKLAEMMAGKAKLMADVIEKSLDSDDKSETLSSLKKQMLSFKQMLIHDITNSAFADIYAQTIAYGMFAARYHDPTLKTFSRQEASELIPKSNPFLRKLFHEVAGPDLDNRLVWIVDELVSIFLATDVAYIMKNFGKSTKQEDPVVHFYETFLASYNPALRKARGVWYTPQPVVNFIVRAVDDILKTEFNLPQGLADTSKIKIKRSIPRFDERAKEKSKIIGEQVVEEEIHKVQILDPATGTGTFLAEVVKHIHKKFEGQQGIWSNYVNQHLIPRLNGFELLMASYAMAHLKMDMLLTETGYKATSDQRFRIFLTNSLEEANESNIDLFSQWLSDEANKANSVKNETPVMVIIGNPPYAVSSSNKGAWIQNLIDDYKQNLNERKINLDDDYIKFIRFGQHFIDKNGEGILAFISNNSFIDGITHRQMRKHLLSSFNKIYIVDLHGNSSKKEVSPDGTKDENVFDIQQGVSINIFIKSSNLLKEKSTIRHIDLFGRREDKYKLLIENSIASLNWQNILLKEPYNFFVPKNFNNEKEYFNGFGLNELFLVFNSGVKTDRDELFIDIEKSKIESRFKILLEGKFDLTFKDKYNVYDSSSFNLTQRIARSQYDCRYVISTQYRPFDKRFIYYDEKLVSRPAYVAMKHLVHQDNIGLVIMRQYAYNVPDYCYSFISKDIIECRFFVSNKGICSLAPLYKYPEKTNQASLGDKPQRVPNLNMEIVDKIAESAGYYFAPEEPDLSTGRTVEARQFYPIDILDYIYAVLHSPSYREQYKEFLKIDFPRVPYPSIINFMPLVQLGRQLRALHLLESDETENYITQYSEDGSNEVVKPLFVCQPEPVEGAVVLGKVFINETQYFNNVPEVAWNFYIGGYQPAQKWLKDRKGRFLEFDDILHYQKIIVALKRTSEIMVEIDKVMEVN